MRSMQSMYDETVVLGGKPWAFDENVANCFENMLQRSIPDYATMRYLVHKLGTKYANKNGTTSIVDLGCSDGQGVEMFIDGIQSDRHFHLIDCSKPMIDKVNEKYSAQIQNGEIFVECASLLDKYPATPAHITLSIFTMQFLPIEERQRIIGEVFRHTYSGGAFIFVEKILGEDEYTEDVLTDAYYDIKRENGYNEIQIMSKRNSLRNVLAPLKPSWNEEMLKKAGFKHVYMFWRSLNFAGWIAVKE